MYTTPTVTVSIPPPHHLHTIYTRGPGSQSRSGMAECFLTLVLRYLASLTIVAVVLDMQFALLASLPGLVLTGVRP